MFWKIWTDMQFRKYERCYKPLAVNENEDIDTKKRT